VKSEERLKFSSFPISSVSDLWRWRINITKIVVVFFLFVTVFWNGCCNNGCYDVFVETVKYFGKPPLWIEKWKERNKQRKKPECLLCCVWIFWKYIKSRLQVATRQQLAKHVEAYINHTIISSFSMPLKKFKKSCKVYKNMNKNPISYKSSLNT
jgi:hypothetical protein